VWEGVAANATERAVRGGSRTRKSDGIYRAHQRGESTHARNRTHSAASELQKDNFRVKPGMWKLRETRRAVDEGWWAVPDILIAECQPELTAHVTRFAQQMPPALTEREQLAAAMQDRQRRHPDSEQSRTP